MPRKVVAKQSSAVGLIRHAGSVAAAARRADLSPPTVKRAARGNTVRASTDKKLAEAWRAALKEGATPGLIE